MILNEKRYPTAAEMDAALYPHQAAELTGGSVPAHVPGAYPRLSCCGGPVPLVDSVTGRPIVDEDRPISPFRIGDPVRIRPHAQTSFAGERGIVTGLFHVGGEDWTINVRPTHNAVSWPFAASQVELAEVGDYMIRALQCATLDCTNGRNVVGSVYCDDCNGLRPPTCDHCNEPEDQDPTNGRENDWNGDTGCHVSCEAMAARLAAR